MNVFGKRTVRTFISHVIGKLHLIAEKDFKLAKSAALDAEEGFLREQAGIIAASLTDGAPCPVCGSLSHPSPAQLSEGAPSENDIKRLKSEADKNAQNEGEKAKIDPWKSRDIFCEKVERRKQHAENS